MSFVKFSAWCLVFAGTLTSAVRAQDVSLESTRAAELRETEEQLNQVLERDLVLVNYEAGPNFPFDFGMIASFKVTSRLRAPTVCEMQVIDFKLVPERHYLREGPTFERAIQQMLSSRLTLAEGSSRSVFTIVDEVPPTEADWEQGQRDCAALEDYGEFFDAPDVSTAELTGELIQEFFRARSDISSLRVTCERMEETGCRSLAGQVTLTLIDRSSKCQQDENVGQCVSVAMANLGRGSSILIMRLSKSENAPREIEVHLSLFLPPVV